ncbi:MAG: tetratricopeptide repeat protein [Thiotrichaceae bacterium]|nr:tetratricopeptide repeat protein [Thiotrichaceae bacterium]
MSQQPYIGLRPFERDETDIFFGRETHTDELISRLGKHHFLAVVGVSGCGKSSLVKTGLIAGLEAGYLATVGTHWRVVEMRPSHQPFQALAERLFSELEHELGSDYTAESLQQALRQGSLSLHELLAQYPLPNNAQLLIVCDQFEEIFRYFQQGAVAEARNFVSLLLASSKAYPLAAGVVSHSIYVVITMRSDFLGDCAQFAGLVEAINQGLYLTPRLDVEQLRAAIEEPAFVFGGEIEAALVTQLLEDAENNPDQLPLLQHVLMRLWNLAQVNQTALNTQAYEALGGLKAALSNHADEVYNALSESQQGLAEVLFRGLTERGDALRDTRRPLQLAKIVELAGVTTAEMVAVIDAFRQADCCFLMPPLGLVLQDETVIDISHESLIRQWERLKDWAADEAESVKTYQRLEDRALEWQKQKAGLLQSPELENFQQWWQVKQPSPVWAQRYGEQFAVSSAFLQESQKAWLQEQERAEKEKQRAEEQAKLVVQQKELALEVISQFTYEIPEKLAKIPQTAKLTAEILEYNIQALDKIYALNPNDSNAQRERAVNYSNVGNLYLDILGNVNKALDYYQQSSKLLQQLVTQDPNNAQALRDVSISFNKLGDIYLQLNQTEKALDYYQQALKIRQQGVKQDPNNAQALRDVSISFENLGDIYLQLNQTDKALDYYQQDLKISQQGVTQDPNNTQALRDVSVSFNNLGNIYLQLNQTEKALDYYQQSSKLLQQLVTQDPNNAQALRDVSVSFNKLGNIYLQLNQTDKALDYYQQDLKISQQRVTQDPNNAEALRDVSISFNKLGNIYLQLNQTEKALDYYQQALKIRQQGVKQDPNNAQALRDLFASYGKLGSFYKKQKQHKEAQKYFEQALPIAEKLAEDKMNYQAQQDLKILQGDLKSLKE